MKPAWLILPCVLVVQGCALPVPVRLASWAIDGIVLVATKRSIPEHGISMIAQKDCSFLRGVMEQKFCIDDPDQGTAIAAADGGAPAAERADDLRDLAAFGTAAGGAALGPAVETDSPRVTEVAAFEAAKIDPSPMFSLGEGVHAKAVEPDRSSPPIIFASAAPSIPMPPPVPRRKGIGAHAKALAPHAKAPAPHAKAPAPPVGEHAPITVKPRETSAPGVYYVVGSFVRSGNAAKLAKRHATMDPVVVAAELDGRQVYRVIVGPFAMDEHKGARRWLSSAGIYDAWGIVLDPASWTLVRHLMPKSQEIAGSAFAAKSIATY